MTDSQGGNWGKLGVFPVCGEGTIKKRETGHEFREKTETWARVELRGARELPWGPDGRTGPLRRGKLERDRHG